MTEAQSRSDSGAKGHSSDKSVGMGRSGNEEQPFVLPGHMAESGMEQRDSSGGILGSGKELTALAARQFAQTFDEKYGGFGEAPKFPTPHNLLFLMMYAELCHEETALEQVRVTLEQMRRGGLFDQIGYGFSRYSTDRYYLVPHFEKMLYDNALLILAYCRGYQALGEKLFLQTARQTADYVFRELSGECGEFFSAQDADSEGEEGKFYVWEYEEVCHVLGQQDGERFCRYYGITREGNFEGKNIANLLNGNAVTDEFERERQALYEYRKGRAGLHLDDKVLTSWNALMICALSALYRATGEERYLQAAEKAGRFIEEQLADGNVLYVSCRKKKRSVKGFLDEYAYDTWALLSLYEVTSNPVYLARAGEICREAEKQFADTEGGYFLYGKENTSLIMRPKETYDGALPSGNSVMAYCLVRLAQLEPGEPKWKAEAERQLAFLSRAAGEYPQGHSMFLMALLAYGYPPQKITVVLSGEDTAQMILPRLPWYADVTFLTEETPEYRLLNQKTTYYVCRDFTCLPPGNEMPEEKEK
ncbi:MAG: thioredoxin domain-containing protein [Lachnospiraceae bacterium]|nr:thioredoxin domain-containing protein [Lachnospiraceae bacterium]